MTDALDLTSAAHSLGSMIREWMTGPSPLSGSGLENVIQLRLKRLLDAREEKAEPAALAEIRDVALQWQNRSDLPDLRFAGATIMALLSPEGAKDNIPEMATAAAVRDVRQARDADPVPATSDPHDERIGEPWDDPAPATDDGMAARMATAFLSWPIPRDFAPDGGISFEPTYSGVGGVRVPRQPVGTNLFTYSQALAMARYMLAAARSAGITAQGGTDV